MAAEKLLIKNLKRGREEAYKQLIVKAGMFIMKQ